MRTTLACQWCRKSKIKCHHEGVAPCRLCEIAGRQDCTLTIPVVQSKKRQRHGESTKDEGQPSSVRAGQIAHGHDPETTLAYGYTASPDARSRPKGHGLPHALPERAVLMEACELLFKLFPEFGFLHRPTFIDQLQNNQLDPVKLCAILCVTSRYMPRLVARHGSPNQAADYYAQEASKPIMDRVVDRPDPDTVQILLLLGLHDWGSCRSFRAWMYTGMAIRMAQALQVTLQETMDPTLTTTGSSTPAVWSLQQECTRRTIWACFVMDCLLGGGKHRPQSFQSVKLSLVLPMGETDFTFESQPTAEPGYLSRLAPGSAAPSYEHGLLDCDASLSTIIRGLDIWSTLSSWICAGGRRLEAGSVYSSPWNEASLWHRTKTALHLWKNGMSHRLHYSIDNKHLQAHILQSQGEPFVFINLLYHLNSIFLHREYVPFLPHRCQRPQGPIDPPFLVDEAPHDWWRLYSRVLFDSAASIVDIVRAAEDRRMQCKTIFISFGIYSSAATLLYAHAWPHMAPDATDVLSRYEWAFEWLQNASGIWTMVKGWIETLNTLSTLYDRIKRDKVKYRNLGREQMIRLEDQVQRFAEVENPKSPNQTLGGHGAAEALLTLAQGQSEAQERLSVPDGAITHTDPNPNMYGDDAQISFELPDDFAYDPHSLLASQDLLASIMGDSRGDWSYA